MMKKLRTMLCSTLLAITIFAPHFSATVTKKQVQEEPPTCSIRCSNNNSSLYQCPSENCNERICLTCLLTTYIQAILAQDNPDSIACPFCQGELLKNGSQTLAAVSENSARYAAIVDKLRRTDTVITLCACSCYC